MMAIAPSGEEDIVVYSWGRTLENLVSEAQAIL